MHTGAVYQVTQPPVGPITEDTFWATRHFFHDDGVVKWCVATGVEWSEVLDQRKKIHIRTRESGTAYKWSIRNAHKMG